MINSDKDINEEIQELNDLILYFNVLIASSKEPIPPDVVSVVVNIFSKTANIMNHCLCINKENNEQLDESLQMCLSLADQVRALGDENEELRKFVDAAKKFPGFNC
jgi:hypothetical protein